MAIAFTVRGTPTATAATTSVTVSGVSTAAGSVVLVFASIQQTTGDQSISSVTVGGNNATRATYTKNYNGAQNQYTSIWYYVPTGALSNASVVATASGSADVGVTVVEVTGADTTAPIGENTGDTGLQTWGSNNANGTLTLTTTVNNSVIIAGWTFREAVNTTSGTNTSELSEPFISDGARFPVSYNTQTTTSGNSYTCLQTSDSGGWFWNVAAVEVKPAGLAIYDVDTGTNSGTTVETTVATVPSGALLVILAVHDSDSATNPTCATTSGLECTLGRHSVMSGNVGATIFTAPNPGTAKTNETVTVTHTTGSGPHRLVVVTLTGADTTALTNLNNGTIGYTTSISATSTSTTAGSYVFAAVGALGAPVSPTTGTTELYDSQPGWFARNTDPSSGGTVTISGTQTQANGVWITLEVKAATGSTFEISAPTETAKGSEELGQNKALELSDVTQTANASDTVDRELATGTVTEISAPTETANAIDDNFVYRAGFGNPTYGATGGGSSAAATFTVAYPAGIQAGDLLLLHCYTRATTSGTSFSQPADWGTIKASTTTASMGSYAVYYKIATGSESGSLTVTGNTNNNTELGIMARVPGASYQFIAGQETTGTTYTTSQTNAGVTPAESNSLVVWLAGFMDASADATDEYSAWTGGTNVTGWTGYSNTETTGSDATVGIAIGRQSTAAATGTLTVTKLNLTSDSGVSYSYAISPRKERWLEAESAFASDTVDGTLAQGDQKSVSLPTETANASDTLLSLLAVYYASLTGETAWATDTVLPNKSIPLGAPTETARASETLGQNKAVTGPNTEIEEDRPTASDTLAQNKAIAFPAPTETAWASDTLLQNKVLAVPHPTDTAWASDTQDGSVLEGIINVSAPTETTWASDVAASGMAWGVSLGTGGGTVASQTNVGNTTTNATWDIANISAAAGSIVVVAVGGASNAGYLRDLSSVTGVESSASFTALNSAPGSWRQAYGYYYVVGGTPFVNETIRLTYASTLGGTSTRAVTIAVIEGQTASPIGAYPTKSAGGTTLDISVTPEAVGSYVYAAFGNDGSDAAAPTANSDSTILAEQHNGALQDAFTARLTNPTTSTSPIVVGSTKTGQSVSGIAVEVKVSQGSAETAFASDTVSPTVSADEGRSADQQDDAWASDTLLQNKAISLEAPTETAWASETLGQNKAIALPAPTETAWASDTEDSSKLEGVVSATEQDDAFASETLGQNKALSLSAPTETAWASETLGQNKALSVGLPTETGWASDAVLPNKGISAGLPTETAWNSDSVLPNKAISAGLPTETAWASETLGQNKVIALSAPTETTNATDTEDASKLVGQISTTEQDDAYASDTVLPQKRISLPAPTDTSWATDSVLSGMAWGVGLGQGGTVLSQTSEGITTSVDVWNIATPVSAPAGSIVVVVVSGASDGGQVRTISSVTGVNSGATFTQQDYSGGAYKQAYTFYYVVGTALSNETIRITYASTMGSATARACTIAVIEGQTASPIGASPVKDTFGTTLDINVTPEATGSFVYGAFANDGSDASAPTANANSTILQEQHNGTLQDAFTARLTNPTTSTSEIALGATKTNVSMAAAAIEIKTGGAETARASDTVSPAVSADQTKTATLQDQANATDTFATALAAAYVKTVQEYGAATDTVIPALGVAQFYGSQTDAAAASDAYATRLWQTAALQESAIAQDAWSYAVSGGATFNLETTDTATATDAVAGFMFSGSQRFFVWNGSGWV